MIDKMEKGGNILQGNEQGLFGVMHEGFLDLISAIVIRLTDDKIEIKVIPFLPFGKKDLIFWFKSFCS